MNLDGLKRHAGFFLFVVLAFPFLTLDLSAFPPIWFDEGWVLSLARNWSECSHYGLYLEGAPVSGSMVNVGFPFVAPIASSFRWFGVGIFQARLVAVLFAVSAFLALYAMSRRLYGAKSAVCALVLSVILAPSPGLNPLIAGRQTLGEMPMLFFVLAGFMSFSYAWRRPIIFVPLTALLWALAALTKLHCLPFLSLSLFISLCSALHKRHAQSVVILVTTLTGFLLTYELGRLAQRLMMGGSSAAPGNEAVYGLGTFVPLMPGRLTVIALGFVLAAGLITSFVYAFTQHFRISQTTNDDIQYVRLVFLLTVTLWYLWYVLCSIGWVRYLMPPFFLGSALVGWALTQFRDRTSAVGGSSASRPSLQPLTHIVTVYLSFLTVVTIVNTSNYYRNNRDQSASEVCAYLNERMTSSDVVETYDMELLFMLRRKYHYPPVNTQVDLNRRTFLGENTAIRYDPLASDPDYLVIGPQSKIWGLYDAVLQQHSFKLDRHFARYDVYARVRYPQSRR